MSEWKMKRFWTKAEVAQAGAGFCVQLDGRSIKTPGKADLIVPTRALAEAMAGEWAAQDGEVRPETMPVTKSANSAIDKVTVQHGEVAQMLAGYAETDLVCYRASHPEALRARQGEAWDPLLAWCSAAYGAPLDPVTGVMFAPQRPESLAAIGARIHGLDAFALTGMHELITLTGSAVLGLAIFDGHLSATAAWDLSRIDETWQAEQWGEDDEANQMAEAKKQGLLHGARFCELLVQTAS